MNFSLNTMLRSCPGLALAGALMVAVGVAQAQAQSPQPRTPDTRTQPAGQMASVDSDFLKQAAQNNNAEIEASRLAVAKGNGIQVKAFAQKMIDDHGSTSRELAALASAKGVEISTDPSVMQKGKLTILSARDKDTFDQRYIDAIVEAHHDTITLFQKAAAEGKDADVKAFVTRTLPTLQQHLQSALQLRSRTTGVGK